jgi:hypothetical protein
LPLHCLSFRPPDSTKHFSKGASLRKPGLAALPKLPEFFLSAAKVHNVPAASWK